MTKADRIVIFVLRLMMAWTFLYAASHQIVGDFSVVNFLKTTKTNHALFEPFTTPTLAPITAFLVAYGHLLIGLSLLAGLLTPPQPTFQSRPPVNPDAIVHPAPTGSRLDANLPRSRVPIP